MRRTQTTQRMIRMGLVSLSVVVCATLLLAPSIAQDQGFDAKRQAMSISPATQSEQAIVDLLKAGLAENKPTQAIAITQQWLRQNVAEDPMLLYLAGKAAELSGDWKSASALYRQYLTRADLKSEAASDAVLGAYTLLINQLADVESAYAFANSSGHRLVANAQARQFDRWFLNEAKQRKDHQAVALRLLALVDAKVDRDLLAALYEPDARWLLNAINNGRLDQGRYSKRFVKTVQDLAKSAAFDDELSLLLDWSVSVKVYNMALLDGEQAAPPIAQAQALLSAYPRHAKRVQTGWAGSRGRYYRGDPKKYWPLELEAKRAPVRSAVAKLDPLAQADYDQSLSTRYYDGYPQLLNAEQARAWVLANPKRANSKVGPMLAFNWNNIKLEDAKKLAPHLAKNPSPEAAGIRAIASVSDEAKELDKAVDTLLKNEAWRLSSRDVPGYIDRLWRRAGRPGGNARRDQLIALSKPIIEAAKKTALKKEDPANKRLAVVKKLWQDYRSEQPKILGVRQRLMQALQVTPQAIGLVLGDPSIEAQLIARAAIDAGFVTNDPKRQELFHYAPLSTKTYHPSIQIMAGRYRSYDQLKQRMPEIYKPHPLHAALEGALTEQLKKGQAQPWLVMAWINASFIEKSDASIKLMADLLKSPGWKSLPYEVRYGARSWFKQTVLTPRQLAFVKAADVNLICKPLVELPGDADVAATAAALEQTLKGLKASPVHHEIRGLDRILNKAKTANRLEDPKLLALVYELIGPMRSFQTDPYLGGQLLNRVTKDPDPAVLHRIAPYLWRHTEVHYRTLPGMIQLAGELADKYPSVSQTLARIGLQTIARHKRGHTYYKKESDIPALKAIRGKATLAMGLIDIPVPKSHPAYGVYQSQAEYTIGNEDSAREMLADHLDQLLAVHRDLSPSYLLWVLQSTIDNRDEAMQEALAKALMAWMQQSPGAFTLDQRIALEIAYGDIALQRGLLPEAQKIFAQIRKNEQYQASFARHTATLRQVLVQRISGDYDGAMQTLMELDAEKIPRLKTAAHYARAEVFYAMEDYQDSAEQIEKVLEREPNHPDATILRGRVQLKLQKLIEATEVELGSVTAQASIVPGEMLKVTLNDPTLSVSSGASDIEVVVWATSGDKEYLLLRQFGDQKTKYRGEVRTNLGEPKPEDGSLQVVGDDEIFYAYSERFRKKMVNLGENKGGPITVASDAVMMASARKLLSENEQRAADMRAATEMLEKKYRRSVQNIDPEKVAQVKADQAARQRKALLEARVKPGNPIYLRVVDLDRGRTAGVDELAVSLSASSGDLVGRVILKETGAYTGTFEGRIQTSEAQSLAFGSSSEAGRNPNMTISPREGYPAWRPEAGAASGARDHALTVDLNDNAALGKLTIDASDEGYALKRFIVQTGMSQNAWSTVASYPESKMAVKNPWRPSVYVVAEEGLRAARGARPLYESLNAVKAYLRTGWLATPELAFATNVAGPSAALPKSIPTAISWKTRYTDQPAVIAKFQAYFYEPASVTRRFALDLGKYDYKPKHKSRKQAPELMIVVNGRVITSKDGKQLAGQINLKPGVHKIEVYATGWIDAIGFGRDTRLRANLGTGDQMIACPDSFFDPATFPEGQLDHRNGPASIAAAEDGKQFSVSFAQGSRARLVRLIFVEQQGPVPSVNKLKLTRSNGETLLPVAEDYAQQRKNDTLEIITGDRVTVRYVDDRFVTKGRQKHERFLNVAYTDAKVEFADIEPRFSSRHQSLQPYHEKLLRFEHNKPLSLVVHDADMDTSVQPDEIKLTISNDQGASYQRTAVETGPSTGTFRVFVTPVTGQAKGVDQVQVAEGGRLTLTYNDAENIRPGVPYERVATIDHAAFGVPRIEVAHATIVDFVPEGLADGSVRSHMQSLNERLVRANEWGTQARRDDYADRIATRFRINQKMLAKDEAPGGGLAVVHGRVAMIDVIAPQLALGEASAIKVYLQTDSGRKAAGVAANAAFDPNVPGTLALTGQLGLRPDLRFPERGGFVSTFTDRVGTDYERQRLSLEEGRFKLAVPLLPGLLPKRSYADREAIREAKLDYPDGLVAKTGERIHIGVAYKDKQGKKRWATAWAKVITRPIIDAMQEDYRTERDSAHVGEKLYVRVVDLAGDKTPERDSVNVYMASKSGQKHYFTLTETDTNSGVFKGVCQLTYAKTDEAIDPDSYSVARQGFPVTYGDTLGIRYTDPSDTSTPVHYIKIQKGSDGTIAPFSKQYGDDETAMRTQFAMAEAFLELARKHRKLGEEKQATHEFRRAKQLLESAITRFNDAETRSHAEYLLGTLTMEDAQATEAGQLRDDRFQAALARFMTVTGSYPDTAYASKAQFQTAVIYEQLREPEIAAQEYVKLAYKYPESEHLATAMARLGTHFQRKAVAYEKKAAPLLKQEGKDALYEGEVLSRLAKAEYIKAAQIFERLQERFPSDDLAGKAGLRAGQIYMRAEDYGAAVKALQRVIDTEAYDGVTLRSEAMYWAGMSHQELSQPLLAYALFKRITYDFPESKWAAYARSQLSTEKMLILDRNLEIERLEGGQ